jgi:hypothetical protein
MQTKSFVNSMHNNSINASPKSKDKIKTKESRRRNVLYLKVFLNVKNSPHGFPQFLPESCLIVLQSIYFFY